MPDAVLLFDDACGLCAKSVRFVLKHERRHALRFAGFDSAFGRAVRARHSELDGVDSLIWIELSVGGGEVVATRSEAVLRVASYLAGPWRLAAITRVVPRVVRDGIYDVIARHRHLLADRPACLVPPPAARGRFLA